MTNINSFNQIENLNNIYSLIMNIFCFYTVDQAITFNSNFAKNYDSFLDSLRANHLLFYNKQIINNLRVIFRNILVNPNTFNKPDDVMKSTMSVGFEQVNGYNNIDNANIKYSFLHLSKDGVLFSEGPGNKIANVLFSFNYNTIKDCSVELVPKQLVLPKQMLMSEANKCCIKMQIDMKDVYDNVLFICSFRHTGYQCNLEAKFLQETFIHKCSHKLNINIGYAFENNLNMRSYLMSKSFFYKFLF